MVQAQLEFLQYLLLKAENCRIRGNKWRVAFDLNSRYKNIKKALHWCEGEVYRMMYFSVMDIVRKYCSRVGRTKGFLVAEE